MSMAMDRINSIGKRLADGLRNWDEPILVSQPSERVCTEAEARTKWCPHAVQAHPQRSCAVNRSDKTTTAQIEPLCLCFASRCMAWRWQSEPSPMAQGLGFCGLAGEP